MRNKGFTLVEFLIVMIVYGIVMVTLIRAYEQYILYVKLENTRQNISTMNENMASFFNQNFFYPCPGVRDVGIDSADFGAGLNCDVFFPDTNPAMRLLDNEDGTYTFHQDDSGEGDIDPGEFALSTGDCWRGICLVKGARASGVDFDENGVAEVDFVLIGAPPISAMRNAGLPVSNLSAFDGWGNMLVYAVTLNLTHQWVNKNGALVDFKTNGGAIQAIDELRRDTAGMRSDAHFAFISVGPDEAGGYGMGGILKQPCTKEDPDDDTLDSSENCDLDAIFMAGLGQSRAAGAEYFDDIARFGRVSQTSYWYRIAGSDGRNIQNANVGNVGINTQQPKERLDVDGALRTTSEVRASRVCTKAGEACGDIEDSNDQAECFRKECFNIADFSKDGQVTCPPGQVMAGFYDTNPDTDVIDPECIPVEFEPIGSMTCPAGRYITGIRSNGEVICFGDPNT
ncbi:MAG: prepilin-type N-terminal cleavage/methylation domain-containing protein [Alphaproteobacteria bacterium]|nr:prepilin-type N-terminal cleavage/methylation domain-containing protein [Alphaproteobacteria bacterium]